MRLPTAGDAFEIDAMNGREVCIFGRAATGISRSFVKRLRAVYFRSDKDEPVGDVCRKDDFDFFIRPCDIRTCSEFASCELDITAASHIAEMLSSDNDEVSRRADRRIETFDDRLPAHPHCNYKDDAGYERDKRRNAQRPKQRRLSE